MVAVEYSYTLSATVAALLALCGVGYVVLTSRRLPAVQLQIFVVAYLARLIAVVAIFAYLRSIGGDGFAFTDDLKYHNAGKLIAKALELGRDGYELHAHEQNVGYFYFIGWLYHTLAVDTLTPRVINAFVSALSAVLVFRIGYELYDRRVAVIAGWVFALLPNLVYISALQFKDPILIFLIAWITYVISCELTQRIGFANVAPLMLALMLLWLFRRDFCLPIIGILVVWLLFRVFRGSPKIPTYRTGIRWQYFAAALVASLLVLLVISQLEVGQVFYQRFDGLMADRAGAVASGELGFSRYLRIDELADLYKLPVSILFVLAMPLPLLGGLADPEQAGIALYAIANVGFLLLLPLILVGFGQFKHYRTGHEFTNQLVLKWNPLLLLMAITVVYMGVLRYKEQLMPYFVLWAALVISRWSQFRSKLMLVYLVYALMGFAMLTLSMVMRGAL